MSKTEMDSELEELVETGFAAGYALALRNVGREIMKTTKTLGKSDVMFVLSELSIEPPTLAQTKAESNGAL